MKDDTPFEMLDAYALLNIRQWIEDALEAKGAKVVGAGIGIRGELGMADLDIEVEGFRFNLEITPLVRQSTEKP